jgi:ABC-2 type transport system ATP-binding protein
VFLFATRLKRDPVQATSALRQRAHRPPRPASTSPPRRPALAMTGVHKSYRDVSALCGVDLEIEPGEIVALLGANAAGKTTLISVAAALCRPDTGDVWVDGVNMLTHPERGRRSLGLSTQETGVYPSLSVRDNLRFFGELAGLRRKTLDARLESVAEAFGLPTVLDRETRTLSVGEVRRLHTAMIMLGRPPVLLLDEPTTGVDVGTRARMLELVRDLATDGSAVCYSTHYLVEAEQLGASVAVLHHGRIVARDTLQTLIDSYGRSAIELRFDGSAPRLVDVPCIQRSGATLRVATGRDAAQGVASLLAALGDSITQLRDVRLIQPNLESVFLALTGQASSSNGERLEVAGDT